VKKSIAAMASRWLVQEGLPYLRSVRLTRSPLHRAQDRSFRDLEAENLQLAVNARRTPRRILRNDPENELTDFLARRTSAHANSGPRNPIPIHGEPCTMPANDRIRSYQDQHLSPPGQRRHSAIQKNWSPFEVVISTSNGLDSPGSP
jgi:hypothetical protein